MKTCKFGVVGCGSIAEIAHFPAIQRTQGAELIACCDLDPDTAQVAASKWGASAWFTDYHQMFATCEDLDAVIIATPINGHRNQAVAAAKAGLHMLVEKPLTATNTEAWDIVNACHDNGVKLMVGCDRRFWTHNQWAKDLVEQEVIGRVVQARASMHEHWRFYQDNVAKTDFRLDAALSGGAALTDTGAHSIDLLTWLIGSRVRRAVGIARREATPESYTLNDDVAWALLDFENGATACVSCNRFSPAVSQATELYGTQGTIFTATDAINPFQSAPMAVFTDKDYSIDDLPEILRNYRWPELFWIEDIINPTIPKRWMTLMPPKDPNSYARMIQHFTECILEDSEPLVSGEDGARAVEVMCAVYKSMQTDGWVDLPLPRDEMITPPYYRPLPFED